MHQCYIVSGILLILPIIDFAVAAPTPIVQEKRQAVVDVVHIPEDAITALGKRVDEIDELLVKLLGGPKVHFPKPEPSSAAGPSSSVPPSEPAGGTDVEQPLPSIPKEPSPVSSPENTLPSTDDRVNEMLLQLFGHPESHFIAEPEESSAAGPSSSAPPSEPADGMDIKQPLPSIPKEPSPVSSPENVPPSTDDRVNELLLQLFGDPKSHFIEKPESSSGAGPSSSAPPSEPADGTDIKQPLPSIPKEPSPVSSPENAPPSTDDGVNEMLLRIFGHPESHFLEKPEEWSAAGPSSSAPPLAPADGWTDVEQPLSPIPEEPSPVSSSEHAPQIPLTDDKFNAVWLNLFGPKGLLLPKPEESSLAAARPSSSWLPSGPADEWTDVEQPLSPFHKEPSPVSSHESLSPGSSTESEYELMEEDTPPGPSGPALSTISSADHELMGAHALPNPEPPIEPDHEVMDVPPSSPVSSTNPDPDSPSGKRRKMEKGLWSPTPSGD